MQSNASAESHLPSRLVTARQAKGISQRELARTIGASPSAISEFEKGKRTPNTKFIERIAAELGVSVDFLLGRTTKEDAYSPEVEELAKIASRLSKADVVTLIAMTRGLLEYRRDEP